MKATELRIGNFVNQIESWNDEDVLPKVIQWDESNWYRIGESIEFLEWFEPITLSEKWLINFGFYKKEPSRYGNKFTYLMADWGFTIENSFEEGKWFFGHEYYDSNNEDENYVSMHFCYDLKFVHTLQNIIHSLTGQELEYKKQ
jgi:hypothetical protein